MSNDFRVDFFALRLLAETPVRQPDYLCINPQTLADLEAWLTPLPKEEQRELLLDNEIR